MQSGAAALEEHRLTVATSPSAEWPDQVLEMLHILQTFH